MSHFDIVDQASAILMHVVREDDPQVRTCRQAIGEIFHNLSAVMPRITGLISRTDLAMSESIIIQTIYIAIGPFFSVDAPTPSSSKASEKNLSPVLQALGGSAALRALRLSSLSLIRSVGDLSISSFFAADGHPSSDIRSLPRSTVRDHRRNSVFIDPGAQSKVEEWPVQVRFSRSFYVVRYSPICNVD